MPAIWRRVGAAVTLFVAIGFIVYISAATLATSLKPGRVHSHGPEHWSAVQRELNGYYANGKQKHQ